MTYIVSGGALNSTHSLVAYFFGPPCIIVSMILWTWTRIIRVYNNGQVAKHFPDSKSRDQHKYGGGVGV